LLIFFSLAVQAEGMFASHAHKQKQEPLIKKYLGEITSDLNGEDFYEFVGLIHQYAQQKYRYENSVASGLRHKKRNRFFSTAYILKNAKQYQQEASGDAALSFEKGGVSWDNLDEAGKLVDRKYGHGNSIFQEIDDGLGGTKISVKNTKRRDAIIAQARSQVMAAGGTPIKWEISTDLGARGIRELFSESDNSLIRNIEVVYVPQVTVIP